MTHIPVMLSEVLEALRPRTGSILLDATVGSGGHTAAFLERIGQDGHVYAMDADENAIDRVQETITDSRLTLIPGNYRACDVLLKERGVTALDGALFDLGWSIEQVTEGRRGFSFSRDEPLLMTLMRNPETGVLTAADVVNTWSPQELGELFTAYGSGRGVDRVVSAIIAERKRSPIVSSLVLGDLIAGVLPRRGKVHPATPFFQALRIVVNDEYVAIEEGLRGALGLLKVGASLAVITFHSGEDALVRDLMSTFEKEGRGKRTPKPSIKPAWAEVSKNRRARSARLRIFTKQ